MDNSKNNSSRDIRNGRDPMTSAGAQATPTAEITLTTTESTETAEAIGTFSWY